MTLCHKIVILQEIGANCVVYPYKSGHGFIFHSLISVTDDNRSQSKKCTRACS